MTKQNKRSYRHIKSFQDFENEKVRLHFELKQVERSMEIRCIEFGVYFNLIKHVPVLTSKWLTPIISFIKNFFMSFPQNSAATEVEEKTTVS